MKTSLLPVSVLDAPLDVWSEIASKGVADDPVFFCDLTDIVRKYINWVKFMPRVFPFYAVKCNDSPIVLRLLATLGTGFDCASQGEIKMAIDAGMRGSKIIMANPTKPASHLQTAIQFGVKMMTFDGANELLKIKSVYPTAQLILRIKYDAKIAHRLLGSKFGCDAKLEAPALLRLAKELGLDVIGISFHVGTGCKDPLVYAKAIKQSKKLFEIAQQIGFNLNLLDIGGGFPGEKDSNMSDWSNIINAALDQHFPENSAVRIIAEPGRYFVSSAYTLVTRIHSKREVIRNGITDQIMYFINDGVYGSFSNNVYEHCCSGPKTARDYGKYREEPTFRSTVWGPTCDAIDLVCDDLQLPDMQVTDLMVFENMGAYTIPIASPFNGFPIATVVYFMERGILSEINCPSLIDFIQG